MNLPIQTFTGATVLENVLVWLAAAAFLVGAIVNASGHPKIRAGFVQLGFPFWWCWVTSALELVTAFLLITAGTRYIGVGLGACIMLAAIALTTYGMPLVVEIGIFFDVVVAVMVLGILVFRIRETFASMDVSKLNELKW